MHPAQLPLDEFEKQCVFRNDRRGGPGGQHRNKVETAVIATHQPSGLSAEANEKRSQGENRFQAIHRLRLTLAIEFRDPHTTGAPSSLWQSRRSGSGRLAISVEHDDYPAIVAELMDVLHIKHYELPPTSEFLGVSNSQLLKLLRSTPQLLLKFNSERVERGLPRLR